MLNLLLDHIRFCSQCGKHWGNFDWLCSGCENKWFEMLSVKKRWISPEICHHYFVGWQKGDGLDSLVHSLKGGGRRRVFQNAVPFFRASKIKGPLYYPSNGTQNDHALELADCFSDLYGGDPQGLLKLGIKKQALLRRHQRRHREFEKVARKPREAYLIDDIVTSGGTALGCWKALGRPAKMTVWSLFYRKSL